MQIFDMLWTFLLKPPQPFIGLFLKAKLQFLAGFKFAIILVTKC